MKKVFTAKDPTAIVTVRGLLAKDGIETRVLNEYASAITGMIPSLLGMPEVWVVVARMHRGRGRLWRGTNPVLSATSCRANRGSVRIAKR